MVTNDKVFNIMMSEAASPMEYSGTLPLDLEEFPVITNDDGTISNINFICPDKKVFNQNQFPSMEYS